jgi:large subunit ribosomal protein L33
MAVKPRPRSASKTAVIVRMIASSADGTATRTALFQAEGAVVRVRTARREGFRLRGNPYIHAPNATRSRLLMAKATTIKVKLVSSADTGFYYVTRKNSRTMTEKLVKKKYDPVAKKHVEFRESKIK